MTLTNLRNLLALVFSVLLLNSCANTAHIEKDPSINLGNYKTYSWMELEKNNAKIGGHKNDIAEANIRRATNQELQKSGFTEVKRNPDLLLTYDLLVEKNVKEQNNPVYSRPFSRVYFNPYLRRYGTINYPSQFLGYSNYSTPVKEGTVTISIIDPKSDKTVWQGWATDEISSSHITGKEIRRNVKSIFRKFEVASK